MKASPAALTPRVVRTALGLNGRHRGARPAAGTFPPAPRALPATLQLNTVPVDPWPGAPLDPWALVPGI